VKQPVGDDFKFIIDVLILR